MPTPLSVAVIGLGPIGLAAARLVARDPGMTLHGLVDLAPHLAGTTPIEGGPAVTDDAAGVLRETDVAIVSTTSSFPAMRQTLEQCIAAKTHVVSSCEEMLFPDYRHAALGREINAAAEAAGVALLGTGVNPGFVLDWLPLVASFAVAEVDAVHAIRRVDASTRRKPLQEKVGATMSVAAFNERKRAGTIGHKGMAESVAMVAAGLGVRVASGSVEESLEPVVADRKIPSALGEIQPGQVAGMHNIGRWQGQGLSVELDLIMSVGWPERYDEINLSGPTPLRVRVEGGTPGDTATAAAMVNVTRVMPRARPGLRTMLDLGVTPASRAALMVAR